ncbi:MAG: Na/Pi cotransporter family protein [Rhodobacteraceae bacterium]|nr:Na/Pi cotransporter family protein [Paracoccaceae bacterium]
MTGDGGIWVLGMGLAGGLALFLFGMDIMTRALRQVAGEYLRTLLAAMTRNRLRGLLAGTLTTAAIQSSSVTTVLMVGFISAGLMTTGQSVAVILGANVGTTVTAQLLAFDVAAWAMPILTVGFFTSFIARRDDLREYGRVVLGLGLIFFGMGLMADAMAPLRSYPPFVALVPSLDNPLLAVLAGAAFTAVVQSSSATTGLLIVMAGQGLITLEPAIALAMGANIGTCVTAFLASIGKPRAAVRCALIHTMINVAGVMLWIGFIGPLADLARAITPGYPMMDPTFRAMAEAPRQIANVHTIFNLGNALLFIWITPWISRLAEWLIPEADRAPETSHAPRHLDPQVLDVPAIALDATRLEVLRLGRLVQDMLGAAWPGLVSGSRLHLDRVYVMDRPVDLLHRAIVEYLRQISLRDLSEAQSGRLMALVRIANDLEHIGDQIATGMITSARKRLDEQIRISPATAQSIARLHEGVLAALHAALDALEAEDADQALAVRATKGRITGIVDDISRHQLMRLHADAPERARTYAREVEMTEALEDIFKTVRRIAKTTLLLADRAPAPDPQPDPRPDSQSGP